MHRIHFLLLPALACATIASAAVPGDPPSRVARLSYLRGPVSYSPAGVDAWAQASLNRPVVSGDRVWTEPGARDELQVGNAAIRMGGGTLLNVLNLDDQVMQMQVTQGTLDIRVRSLPASGAIEVDTPNLAFSVMRPGHYRIDVAPSGGATMVRVTDGQAQAIGRDRAYLINPGQAFRFGGTDLAPVQLADATGRDDFDRWSAARDQRSVRSRAARYVSPAMIGYEDLDENGTWRDVDGYGPVWTPAHVSRDWAPYRDGHWAWVEPWGWTWVDDAPWGFATTHYGRWTNVRGDWGWVPGPVAAKPVYAPALVMFVAAGNLIQSRREPGDGVAWFPLAPREVYRPSYRASSSYVTNINTSNTIVNQTQITNIYNNPAPAANHDYRNRQVPGAVTAVPARVFTHAQPVRAAAVALPAAILASAPLLAAATVRAQHDSLASGLASGHRPAPAALSRPVMARTAPAGAAGIRPPVAQAVPAPMVPPAAPQGHNPHERNGAQPGWPGGAMPPMARGVPPGRTAGLAAVQGHALPPAALPAGPVMPVPQHALPPRVAPASALPPAAAQLPAPIAMHGRPPGLAHPAGMAPVAPPHRSQSAAVAPAMPVPMVASHGPVHGMPPERVPAAPMPTAAPRGHGHGPEHAMPLGPVPAVPMQTAAPHGYGPAVPMPTAAPHGHGPAHAMPRASVAMQRPVQVAQHAMPPRPMVQAEHANARPVAPPRPPARPVRAEPPPQAAHAVVQHPPAAQRAAPPHPQPASAPRPEPHVAPPHPQPPHHEAPPQHPHPAPGKPEPKEAHHGKD